MGVFVQKNSPDKNLPVRNGEETMKKLIQFKNIVKEFDGNLVLKGINLDIYENEFVTRLRENDSAAYSGWFSDAG